MITAEKVSKSTKRIGRYEHEIIKKLEAHFIQQGYDVVPHASFNIAWGSIISDIDLLLIKDNLLTLIEVKSSHDNLRRAKKQVRNILDFVDFVYVATDYHPRKWYMKDIGFIVVKEKIDMRREAKQITRTPSNSSIGSLKKICLSRMMGFSSELQTKKLSKMDLVYQIQSIRTNGLKNELKEIITCGSTCKSSCPIWEFENGAM
jgi:hypothetical protein